MLKKQDRDGWMHVSILSVVKAWHSSGKALSGILIL